MTSPSAQATDALYYQRPEVFACRVACELSIVFLDQSDAGMNPVRSQLTGRSVIANSDLPFRQKPHGLFISDAPTKNIPQERVRKLTGKYCLAKLGRVKTIVDISGDFIVSPLV
jgi:hypothetical protein